MARLTGFSPAVRRLMSGRSNENFDMDGIALCEVWVACEGARSVHHHHRRPRQRGGSRRPCTNQASNGLCAGLAAGTERITRIPACSSSWRRSCLPRRLGWLHPHNPKGSSMSAPTDSFTGIAEAVLRKHRIGWYGNHDKRCLGCPGTSFADWDESDAHIVEMLAAAATPAGIDVAHHQALEHAVAELIATNDALTQAVTEIRALAEKWRYKGELGWGAWQEGQGPDETGCALDGAASDLRAILDRHLS